MRAQFLYDPNVRRASTKWIGTLPGKWLGGWFFDTGKLYVAILHPINYRIRCVRRPCEFYNVIA